MNNSQDVLNSVEISKAEQFTLEKAHQLWTQFRNKTTSAVDALVPPRKKAVLPDEANLAKALADCQQSQLKMAAVKTLQDFFRSQKTIRVNPNGHHTTDFKYFLHGDRTLHKSLQRENNNAFVLALQQGQWGAAIFKNSDIEGIALACFDNGTISRQQYISFLKLQQYISDFGESNVCIHPLLDEKQQFTPEAKVYLTSIEQFKNTQLTEKQIEQLRLLIVALPLSEQVYMAVKYFEDDSAKLPMLLHTLIQKGTVPLNIKDDSEVLIGSAGLHDALGLMLYGLEQYIPPVHRINPMGPREILEGVRQNIRPAIIAFSSQPPLSNIHQYAQPTRTASTEHDSYHSDLMSTIPIAHRKALLHMIQVLEEKLASLHQAENAKRSPTKQKSSLMTREIWCLSDAELIPSVDANAFFGRNVKASTKAFCELIQSQDVGAIYYCGLADSDQQLTPVGTLILVDILKNKQQWLKFTISPQHMISPFRQGLSLIGKLCQLSDNTFLDFPPRKQALLVHLLQSCDEAILEGKYFDIMDICYQVGIDNVVKFKRDGQNYVSLEIDESVGATDSNEKAHDVSCILC